MNTHVETRNKLTTKVLVYCALLIALSFIGAQIKIFQSVAFDSLPAFFGALLIGPVAGAIIGIAGHLLTAITSGFPQTVPMHLIIALGMGVICYTFGYLNQKINIVANSIIAIFLNGVVLSLIATVGMVLLGMIPTIMETFIFLVGILTPVSAANIIISVILYKIIGDKISL